MTHSHTHAWAIWNIAFFHLQFCSVTIHQRLQCLIKWASFFLFSCPLWAFNTAQPCLRQGLCICLPDIVYLKFDAGFPWGSSDPTSRPPTAMWIFEPDALGFLLQQPREIGTFKVGFTPPSCRVGLQQGEETPCYKQEPHNHLWLHQTSPKIREDICNEFYKGLSLQAMGETFVNITTARAATAGRRYSSKCSGRVIPPICQAK